MKLTAKWTCLNVASTLFYNPAKGGDLPAIGNIAWKQLKPHNPTPPNSF